MKKKKEIILTLVGVDSWDRPVYEVGDTKTYVKDVALGNSKEPSLCWSSPKSDIDGEPNYSFEPKTGYTYVINDPSKKEYLSDSPEYVPSDVEVEAMKELSKLNLSFDESFRYQMLSRLQMDCNYYLGYGNRGTKQLWAGNEKEHIDIMKNLYLSFPDDKKPEWISLETIQDYETKMLNNNDIIETQVNQEEPELEM